MPGGPSGASSLTAAELRLIPYLHTYLAFREIGQRLFVSPNTVKTQAISLYRKLGVSSRGEAMARAEELGLIDR
jgi:LuxR family maltose regulon positive regulatory protein